MPADGSAQLRLLAAHCKAVGSRTLINGARRELRAVAGPMIAQAQANARERLPRSGGLNEQVAGQRWTVQALAGARTAGVRIRTAAPDTVQSNDFGYVRHPSPRNNRKQWRVTQTPAAKGWADDAVRSYGPTVARGLQGVLDAAAAQIAEGL